MLKTVLLETEFPDVGSEEICLSNMAWNWKSLCGSTRSSCRVLAIQPQALVLRSSLMRSHLFNQYIEIGLNSEQIERLPLCIALFIYHHHLSIAPFSIKAASYMLSLL